MVTLKARIKGYFHDFTVFKNNLKKSEEFKSFLALFGELLLFAFLGGMTLLAFTSPSLIIKFIGIGCGLSLFQYKLLTWITQILGSFTLVKNYK